MTAIGRKLPVECQSIERLPVTHSGSSTSATRDPAGRSKSSVPLSQSRLNHDIHMVERSQVRK